MQFSGDGWVLVQPSEGMPVAPARGGGLGNLLGG
jgi:hypothetical protein